MKNAEKFWNKIAKKYSEKPISDEGLYQQKLNVMRDYFTDETKMLEFACGTGSTAILNAPYVKSIDAIDFSESMIEISKGKIENSGVDNITFTQSTIEEYNANEQSYDAILGMSILHLLVDKDVVVNKVHSLLKTGGVFVTSTPCINDMGLMSLFKYIMPIGQALNLMPYVSVFGVDDLKESMTKAGFEIDYFSWPEKSKAVFMVAKKI